MNEERFLKYIKQNQVRIDKFLSEQDITPTISSEKYHQIHGQLLLFDKIEALIINDYFQ